MSIRWDGTDEKAHVKVNGPSPPGGGDPAPAALVLMAPAGDRALAQVRLDLYTLAVPYVGGETPVVSVADPERASVPVRKLTEVGGQFPAWSADGRRAHWSIGNAHFIYDLDDAETAEEAARAAEAAEEAAAGGDDEAAGDGPRDSDRDDDGGEEDGPAYEPVEIRVEVDAIIDGYPGLEHSFPIFPLYRDVVSLAAETRMAYTPTLLVSYGEPVGENWFFTRENPHDDPKLRRFIPHGELDRLTRRRGAGVDAAPGGWFREEEYVFRQHAEGVKAIVEAGGVAGVGSHGQLQGLGYHWELWATQSGGLSEHDALRVATALGAEAIGLDGDLGSIEPAKLADLVVLEANPLDDIRNTNRIRYVMKNGRLYDADTLDETWPRERPLGKPVWLGDESDGEAAGIRP